jgi:hypothetical protein
VPHHQAGWAAYPVLGHRVEPVGMAIESKAMGRIQAWYCATFSNFPILFIQLKFT